jgi:hypothetical protein
MIRRQFIRRTLGVIAGAVCAPFVGKAVARPVPHYVKHIKLGHSCDIRCYGTATIFYDGEVVARLNPGDRFHFSPPPLTQEQRDG